MLESMSVTVKEVVVVVVVVVVRVIIIIHILIILVTVIIVVCYRTCGLRESGVVVVVSRNRRSRLGNQENLFTG